MKDALKSLKGTEKQWISELKSFNKKNAQVRGHLFVIDFVFLR
jgi:hypothetical protein